MKIKLEVPISVRVTPIDEFSYDDMFSYVVETTLQDFVEYFYFKHYNKEYQSLSWYLEEGAKEFVKSIEDDWMHNRIDEFALMNDRDFKKFLKHKYSYAIEREYLTLNENSFEDIKQEMLDFIENNFEVECEVIEL